MRLQFALESGIVGKVYPGIRTRVNLADTNRRPGTALPYFVDMEHTDETNGAEAAGSRSCRDNGGGMAKETEATENYTNAKEVKQANPAPLRLSNPIRKAISHDWDPQLVHACRCL